MIIRCDTTETSEVREENSLVFASCEELVTCARIPDSMMMKT